MKNKMFPVCIVLFGTVLPGIHLERKIPVVNRSMSHCQQNVYTVLEESKVKSRKTRASIQRN